MSIKAKLKNSDRQTNIDKIEWLKMKKNIVRKFKQLFNLKIYVNYQKSLYNWNGSTGFLVRNKELLRFYIIPKCFRNYHAEFEIEKTILTFINWRLKISADANGKKLHFVMFLFHGFLKKSIEVEEYIWTYTLKYLNIQIYACHAAE